MSLATPLLLALVTQGSSVTVSVDVTKNIHPISPYIYGDNQPDWAGRSKYLTCWRSGGNRLTAYNWETNASNAGSDWHNQNDSFMGGGNTPAESIRPGLVAALNAGAAAIVTVPCAGYVAADKNGDGDVNQTPDYINVRFNKSYPSKPGALSTIPNLTDHKVYQDEFVNFLMKKVGTKNPIWFSLDNEPDLWANTHSRIWPTAPTYAQIMDISKAYAQAIKDVAPRSLVFGPASYGWNGYTTFQNAKDANGRFFLEFYLQGFKTLNDQTGKRYLDVLDLHWYPEARGANKRITEDGTEQALYEARVQAPRSLWDPTYKEDSWITQYSTNGPIKLIPLMKQKIAANYPGTKLGITEWNYGGGGHITGGVAVADVLGIFGRESVYAATYWHLKSDESFAYGGFDMFRNFDRKGAHFGDRSVRAISSDNAKVTAYASIDSKSPGEITIVVINKAFATSGVNLNLAGAASPKITGAYRLKGANSRPAPMTLPTMNGNSLALSLPATSVTTLRLSYG